MIFWGDNEYCTFMNSGVFIQEPKKKSPMPALRKRAPLAASDMTELTMNFVSRMDAAGDDVSPEYGSLFPPTTHCTLHGSDFKGRRSQTKVAYVTFLTAGYRKVLNAPLLDRARTSCNAHWRGDVGCGVGLNCNCKIILESSSSGFKFEDL